MNINELWLLKPVLLTLAGGVSIAYGFVPARVQCRPWIKLLAIAAGVTALLFGSLETFQKYHQQGFAYVRHDGTILKSRNFKATIGAPPTMRQDCTVFLMEGESYFGDASRVTVIPQRRVQADAYNAVGGIGIRFHCPKDSVPDFTIEISR